MKKIRRTEMYDSSVDTQKHIDLVRKFLGMMAEILIGRGEIHDLSKLHGMEKECFDRVTPLLKGLTYGSEEYKDSLNQMKPALEHHYKMNRHHPEHFENGINSMSLLDLMEMLVDWYCATKRHDNGDIHKSLVINKDRFGISDQLNEILKNTVYLLTELDKE